MKLRRAITNTGLAAGLALAAFFGAGVNEARASSEGFCNSICHDQDCGSNVDCNAGSWDFQEWTKCGDWIESRGISCNPVVGSAEYGKNQQCTSSSTWNPDSPYLQQASRMNDVNPSFEWDGIKLTYTIPWPSASLDPCFGIGKTMSIQYSCGNRTASLWVSAEAADKTIVLSCPN
jgi:hypothetical protein